MTLRSGDFYVRRTIDFIDTDFCAESQITSFRKKPKVLAKNTKKIHKTENKTPLPINYHDR